MDVSTTDWNVIGNYFNTTFTSSFYDVTFFTMMILLLFNNVRSLTFCRFIIVLLNLYLIHVAVQCIKVNER